jgi:thioredoxin 1
MTTIKPLAGSELESRVLQAEGPVALDFYQESCAPCHALTPRIERVAGQFEGRLPVYRVDVDQDMPIAERFRVMSLPTVLIVDGGKELERLDGLIKEDDLQAAFDRVVDGR